MVLSTQTSYFINVCNTAHDHWNPILGEWIYKNEALTQKRPFLDTLTLTVLEWIDPLYQLIDFAYISSQVFFNTRDLPPVLRFCFRRFRVLPVRLF